MKETSASNRASEEGAINSKWLKRLYVIMLIMSYCTWPSDLSNQREVGLWRRKRSCWVSCELVHGLFDGAAQKDEVSVIVTHCYDSGTSGTSSRTADKSIKFVTKNTHKISHLAVNDPVSDSWLSFTKGQSCSFSSMMFANVVQRHATFTGATSLRGL